jgi:predicted DNA-binding transcriptional regulator YafY
MNTIRVSRIIQILRVLQSLQRYKADDLAQLVGTSKRTIFRDLKILQEAGIPCHFNQKDCGYTIEPQFRMSSPELSEQEAFGLLLLVHKARENVHFPLKDSALKAAIKIETNLPDGIKRYCNAALRHISIKPSNQERSDVLDRVFPKLLTAILRKQIVTVNYYLLGEHKYIVTDLSPYHLMYNNQTWYVLGMSSYHNGISSFKLKHIKELKTLDKCFIEDKNFNVSDYLGRAWSMMPEGNLYNVKLRFLPEVAFSVAETQWHSTQTVTFEDDGSAIIEFRVDGLNEIIWWILGYGDQVQVLAPRVLRQRILEIAKNTVQKNEKSLLP